MKQIIMKRLVVAGLALIAVPSLVLAQADNKQKEKEKVEKDVKEKKEVRSIVITSTGDKDEKMTIVVDGDKITVNGKDIKDLKDINVNVNTISGRGFYRVPGPGGQNAWSYNFNDDGNMTMFHEDANRAMLGVNTDDNEKGAEIQSITEGSAAEKAGLKKGDIITKVAGEKIEDAGDLTKAIRSHKPDEKVEITYLRGGKEQKVTTQLTKWKGMSAPMEPLKLEKVMEGFESPRVYSANGNNFLYSGRPKLGLSIQDTDDGKGVKVLEVDEESNAAKAGIKKDDIILSIDDKEVKGTEDVVRTVRENKDKYTFTFKVQRAGKLQNIEVKFPKKLKTTDL